MSNREERQHLSVAIPMPPGFLDIPLEIVEKCNYIAALSNRNPVEAAMEADALYAKHGNFHTVQQLRGRILAHNYKKMHESENKRNTLREAIFSFREAVNMVPESPLYSYDLATALFMQARDDHAGYEKVVQECERGLGLDLFRQIPRMESETRVGHEKLKAEIEKLSAYAMAALEKAWEIKEKLLDKFGEYWRNLSYDEKCGILDVNVKDVERFYGPGKNKNSRALSILKEAVDMYGEQNHWFSWKCCFCRRSRKKEDYDVMGSVLEHIENHFKNLGPKLTENFDYGCHDDEFDSVEICDGVFVLHNVLVKQNISRETHDAPIKNTKFLCEWLTDGNDVNRQLHLWAKKRGQIDMQPLHTVRDEKGNAISSKHEAVCRSLYDYREIIVPLLKCFMQARLEADANMATFIKEETAIVKNVPTKSKKKKKKRGGNKISNREHSETEMQHEIQAPSAAREEESPDTSEQLRTIVFGSFSVNLKITDSTQEEIAREAVEHPPENVEDDNAGWVHVTPRRVKKT